MTQEQFHHLLQKYREGKCNAEEEAIINDFDANIIKNQEWHAAPHEEEALQNRYLQKAQEYVQTSKQHKQEYRLINWPVVGIAASIALVVCSFIYMQTRSVDKSGVAVSNVSDLSEPTEYVNDEVKPKMVRLPDGSEVTLEQGSKISFETSFNTKQERKIYLTGEAFFNVKRDEQRPFLVYTNEVTTKVLGTSFKIKALPNDKNITVAVKTGKVSVYTHTQAKKESASLETILTPNQQATYNLKENRVVRTIVDKPVPIVSVEEIKKIEFDEASVVEILLALEKIYGVDIVFDKALLSSCTLTTSIGDGEIFNRLNIISNAIGATYTVEGTQIIINSAGCF